MKVQLIDFGYHKLPWRVHDNDAGADVFMPKSFLIKAGTTAKIPLNFGLKLPDGYAAFIYPRSGLASKGIVCELPPIDSGYRGNIHAIVSNVSNVDALLRAEDRIGQLVIMPIIIAEFTSEEGKQRGTGAFASTGN